MTADLTSRATELVHRLGLCARDVTPGVTPLTGGVASDIAAVTWPGGHAAVKFALERLRVAAEWRVPTSRNAAEYAWLAYAGACLPGAAPALFGRIPDLGGFAMEVVSGTLWKSAMLDGRSDGAEADAVARALGQLHAGAAGADFNRTPFMNADLFHALRIEPYLLHTSTRHPGLASHLAELAHVTGQGAQTLIHGDISPKNILIRDGAPVFLDAECASMGDPAFDVAFCVNHLILKGFHRPPARDALWGAALVFWHAYAACVTWEDTDALQSRVAALLPALMLARIDGKSPVEYLSAATQDDVRAASIPLIADPPARIADLIGRLTEMT
jgi:aminoglycoside phosphotransferase (APT) family kinase protein